MHRNTEREGFPPGTPDNPELASILYHHGVLGQREPKGPGKQAAEETYDPETGVRIYLHIFQGESRGADATQPLKAGDVSVHLSVRGPAADGHGAELRKTLDRVKSEVEDEAESP